MVNPRDAKLTTPGYDIIGDIHEVGDSSPTRPGLKKGVAPWPSGAPGCVDDGKVIVISSPEERLKMTTMMLELDDTKAQAFRERARSIGREPEQLLAEFIDQLLNQPGNEIDEAMDYVLAKNRELYRRLA